MNQTRRFAESARFLIAVLFLLCPLTATAQESATTSNVITGRVVTSSGEPLTGGIVYVNPLGNLTQPQPSVINGTGDFRLDNLEPGLYRISANVPGYVPAMPLAPGDTNYFRPGDVVTLTMSRGAVITGVVTGPTGPVVATVVRVIRVRDSEGKTLPFPVPLRDRLTDDRGVYRHYGLLPGTYLVAAGGPPRYGGFYSSTTYDIDAPVYFPSSTRDTASEIVVRSGEEVTADIQFRSEPGHAISGSLAGMVETPSQFTTCFINLIDVRDGSTLLVATTNTYTSYGFALYGVPDGEYELSATQTLPSREILKSEPRRVKIIGTDVSAIKLTLRSQAGIEGRLVLENDPKLGCAKRRDTAAQETVIFARRYEPEIKPGEKNPTPLDVSIISKNQVAEAVSDAKGTFALRNLSAGSFRIDPRPPASGWFLRSITLGPQQSVASRNGLARDGLTLKSGERVSGLTVTMTEGAASIRGRITAPEGQRLPTGLSVYLVPAEKETAADVLQFFETRAESDGTFVIGNIAPGKYWLVARENEARKTAGEKYIRRDSELRLAVLREAEKIKKEVPLKPCARLTDYELPFPP